MLCLLQLLKVFKDQESRASIMQWCEMIKQDESEVEAFRESLLDSGVELLDHHIESLVKICVSGKYISAFKITE
jgi:hypothetical protein